MAAFTFGDSLDTGAASQGLQPIFCYGAITPANEVKDSFGPPDHNNTSAEPFTWSGWNGTDTASERAQLFTSETLWASQRTYEYSSVPCTLLP